MAVEELSAFINYCETKDVRFNHFVLYTIKALKKYKINVFIDKDEDRDQKLEVKFKKIVKSRLALVIFSWKYTKSTNCLKELVKIKDCVEKGNLVAIPIYYNLDVSTVKSLGGPFGHAFKELKENILVTNKWKEALLWITKEKGITVYKKSNLKEKINEIEEKVKERLKISAPEEITPIATPSVGLLENSDTREKDKTSDIKKRNKTRMKLAFLLLLFLYIHLTVYMSVPLILDKEEKFNNSSSKVKTNYFPTRTCPKPHVNSIIKPPQIQVFINFRGDELRNNFISHLVDALQRSGINVFIDNMEQRGEDLGTLFERIEDSGIAIAVFSKRYTESEWCLNELLKIKERVHQGLLKVLPIFYKVTPNNVKRLKGEFGDHFRDKEYLYATDEPKIKRWKEAIALVTHKHAMVFHENSPILENDFIQTIVKEVLKILYVISWKEAKQPNLSSTFVMRKKTS